GRYQHHEVAGPIGDGTMRDRGQADVLLARLIKELEVAIEHRLVLLEADYRFLVAGPLDGDRVARRIDVGERVLRLESDVERELVERGRRLAGRLHRIGVFDEP